jgi:cyclin D2
MELAVNLDYSTTATSSINNNYCEWNIVKSFNDNRILADDRLLKNLNYLQSFIHSTYFETIQNDIKPYMRKIVVGWMMEVCDEENVYKLVFPLAVYILDKFLHVNRITRNVFQLVACVCLFIASKIFNVFAISAERLVLYSDNSITIENLIVSWMNFYRGNIYFFFLKDMEILVLSELKWDVLFVTPVEYVEFLVNKFEIKLDGKVNFDVRKILVHCKTMISLCLIGISNFIFVGNFEVMFFFDFRV